jgi:hypothetical protein
MLAALHGNIDCADGQVRKNLTGSMTTCRLMNAVAICWRTS